LPDATGLELIAQEVRERLGDDVVVDTGFARGEATLSVAPGSVNDVLRHLKEEAEEPFDFLASLHGLDYFPDEPRLAVHYQLLSRQRAERMKVATRMTVEEAELPTVTDLYEGANFQEREVFDFFGITFTGHPDLRRTHMPEDYEGHPQRRDYPIGGEPVKFTFNQDQGPRWYD